jgi:glycosyltransferase involved in cell wall biosynthesis
MKIAIDVSQMCYEGAGVARYVYGLTKAMLLKPSSHQFILYAGTLRKRKYFKDLMQTTPWNRAGWRILPLPPKLAGKAFNLLPFRAEWLVGKVDVFHSSDWSEVSAKCASVTTVHDVVFHKYPATVDPVILRVQQNRLKKIVRTGTHIIADSKSTKNDLMEIYPLPDNRITVIYPGIDTRYKPQSKKEIDRVKIKYNLPDTFVLSVGTQEPRKNIERLTQAMETLDVPLVVVGKHGWGAKTQTLGFVPDADLPAIYSAATVFAYPSLYEGFGFPVLEAMACGAPVVTSDISSLPELAGSAAILVDPENTNSIALGIKKALVKREDLIKKGQAQAALFTWAATAKQTLEVYEKIAHRD